MLNIKYRLWKGEFQNFVLANVRCETINCYFHCASIRESDAHEEEFKSSRIQLNPSLEVKT